MGGEEEEEASAFCGRERGVVVVVRVVFFDADGSGSGWWCGEAGPFEGGSVPFWRLEGYGAGYVLVLVVVVAAAGGIHVVI